MPDAEESRETVVLDSTNLNRAIARCWWSAAYVERATGWRLSLLLSQHCSPQQSCFQRAFACSSVASHRIPVLVPASVCVPLFASRECIRVRRAASVPRAATANTPVARTPTAVSNASAASSAERQRAHGQEGNEART